MKSRSKKSYNNLIRWFSRLEKTGELIDISFVYEYYGRPGRKTPRRLLNTRYFKNFVGCEIQKYNYEIEKVIKYRGKDISVNFEIAIKYLHCIDRENYNHLSEELKKYLDLSGIWDELPENDNSVSTGTDYINPPLNRNY